MSQPVQTQGYLYTFSQNCFLTKEDRILQTGRKNSKNGLILILIADDHPYLIHGVEADLNKDPKLKIVGSCGSYDELLKYAPTLSPDIILMDLKMPGYDNYDLHSIISELKKKNDSKIVIFSNETGWARIHRCLEIGANAYIEKAISLGRLSELIHKICSEDELVVYTSEKLPEIQFSPRQSSILHFIADGKENDQIAAILSIDIKTVQSYVNEIKAKFAEAFNMHPIRPRALLLIASKLGFGSKSL